VVVLFPVLRYVVFRQEEMIPRTLNLPKIDAKTALVDPWGGIFGACLFVITIVSLVGLSARGLLKGVEGVWTVTAPAGSIMLVRDCAHDIWVRKRDEVERRGKEKLVKVDTTKEKVAIGPSKEGEQGEEKGGRDGMVHPDEDVAEARQEKGNSTSDQAELQTECEDVDEGGANEAGPAQLTRYPGLDSHRSSISSTTATTVEQQIPPPPTIVAENEKPRMTATISAKIAFPPGPPILYPLARIFPTTALIFSRLPLPLIPFAFSMFILVEALQYTGWIKVFGVWWAAWARVGGVAGSIWLMGTIGVLGCNVSSDRSVMVKTDGV